MLMIYLLYQNVNLSWSLNEEGLALLKFRDRVFNDPFGALLDWNEEVGVIDPCSWSRVECANGNVVALQFVWWMCLRCHRVVLLLVFKLSIMFFRLICWIC